MSELRILESVVAGDRVVELQQHPDTGRVRVTVDGVAIPTTFSRTAYSTTNAGTYDRVLEAEHPVDWFDLGPLALAKLEFEGRHHAHGVSMRCSVGGRLGEIQGTVIYDYLSLNVSLPPALDRARVSLDGHSDTSA